MKQKIKEKIYSKEFEGISKEIRFSDLPKNIQENDIIDIHREEEFYSENDSYNAYTELIIIREREETDEEYKKRIDNNENRKKELKKQRYEKYLELKKEFG